MMLLAYTLIGYHSKQGITCSMWHVPVTDFYKF